MEDRVETEAYQRMMINATYAGRVLNEWEMVTDKETQIGGDDTFNTYLATHHRRN